MNTPRSHDVDGQFGTHSLVHGEDAVRRDATVPCRVRREHGWLATGRAQPVTGWREGIMATGTVKWFNGQKGFGFIEQEGGGPDVFAHYSNIAAQGYRELQEGQKVSFDITQGPKGPQAENICLV
jgi:cold shock protein